MRVLLLSIAILFTPILGITQNIGINSTGATPDAGSLLDIVSTNKGLLIPRVSISDLSTIAPVTGSSTESMLVYNTNATTGKGFHYWDGDDWIPLFQGDDDWDIDGNSGTTAGTDFLGTTDAVDFVIKTNNSERIRVESGGDVGIGITNPTNRLHVQESTTGAVTVIDNTNSDGIALWSMNSAATSANSGFAAMLIADNTGGAAVAINQGGAASFFPGSALSVIDPTSDVGIIVENTTANATVLQAQTSTATTTGIISLADNGNRGTPAIFAQQDSPSQEGNAYSATGANSAILGQISGAREYSFGVTGLSTSTDNRTGGVIGLSNTVGTWGALGYTNRFGTEYSGYFAGTTIIDGGGDKLSGQSERSGIALASYGDVLGQWTRGNVYGMNIKGNRYGLYVDGKTYTNDIIANVASNDDEQRVVSYVPTSTTVDIVDRGVVQMVNGRAVINFSQHFKNLVSKDEVVFVTATPNGPTNGVYVQRANGEQATIIENGNGVSNVGITWIAVGTRKGYENTNDPKEVMANDFDTNMSKVMSNDNADTEGMKLIQRDGEIQFVKPGGKEVNEVSAEKLFKKEKKSKKTVQNHSN